MSGKKYDLVIRITDETSAVREFYLDGAMDAYGEEMSIHVDFESDPEFYDPKKYLYDRSPKYLRTFRLPTFVGGDWREIYYEPGRYEALRGLQFNSQE